MKIAIIEDEELAAEALAAIIRRLRPEAEIIQTLPSVEEAICWLTLHASPDVIFCDIHLSDGISFEIFRQVSVKCPVIFTTAYNQYAIEAFQVNSIDYLLKPLKPTDVAKALKKYEDMQQQFIVQQLNGLQQLVHQPARHATRARFLVKIGQSIKAIPVEEAAYFMAEEGVVFLVTFGGKRHIINYTLDQLEEQLDLSDFFRANRHLIVHINAVQEVKPYFKGRLALELHPALEGDQTVSSSRAADFKQWLDL
ncbi:LytR/AlgR family response regulator transcription factor [Pontibacter anaerobius]|uniref:LytTR family DNA-binding domain-containing protein n=1 Tax=Pontibacter anaerobius TaxID=2993940 RepID=A0ABT3RJD6_9BACT|nr:LytTR family DNA-binding domain-containing protein [Pontibacter anaerobius]MCX2741799.1 LytTR family DNA-binding domain-containing protein [Pontibacter anaerobius]